MATDVQAARLGLMKFIAKKGGTVPMRELHTHSLVFYQAGHQAFSQLMEAWLETAWSYTTAALRPSR